MSPTGGMECLAGLPPIKLHLWKLSQQAVFQTATLSGTHPLCSVMPKEWRENASPHYGAACFLAPARRGLVKDAIFQTTCSLGKLMETFKLCADEAFPGSWIMDLYGTQVHFNVFDWYGEELMEQCREEINTLFNAVSTKPDNLCLGVDVSVPKSTRHQVTAAVVYDGLVNVSSLVVRVAGCVLSSDAELFVIHLATSKAVAMENCERIVIFTDSLAMARRIVDIQGNSIRLRPARTFEPGSPFVESAGSISLRPLPNSSGGYNTVLTSVPTASLLF